MKTCAWCKKHLKVDEHGMGDNLLDIEFSGGYAQFIDPYEQNGVIKLTLCHECAHDLCANNAFINEALQPHSSHSHGPEYREKHPDHWGWDYDENI